MPKRVSSMSLSKYFEITKNHYTTFQIIPAKHSKSNNSDALAGIVNKIYLNLNDLVKRENKKLVISTNMKVSYYIHITKEEVQFYFIIPTIHIEKFKTKIIEVWKNVEIKQVEKIPCNFNEGTKYQLTYKNNDALSLDTTKNQNALLDANLSTLEILENNESVGIFYNFIPTSARESSYFRLNHAQILEKFKNGENLKKQKNISDILVMSLKFLFGMVNDFLSNLQGGLRKTELKGLTREATPMTVSKGNKDIIKTQIVIHAKSKSEERERTLLNSLANSYKTISSDDNELVAKPINGKINEYTTSLNGVKVNNHSLEETKQYLSVANKELIEEYEDEDINEE